MLALWRSNIDLRIGCHFMACTMKNFFAVNLYIYSKLNGNNL